jgi:hypothetical protein
MKRFNQLELEQISLTGISLLEQAEDWGLREEVEISAYKMLKENVTADPEQAIIWAYEDWIK